LSEGATTQRHPQVLPGGAGVLFTEHSSTTGFDSANIAVAPMAGGAPKVVVRGGYYGRYVPSGPGAGQGHILYFQQAAVFAVPFDLGRLETTGMAVPVLESVMATTGTAGGQLSFSMNGTLAYVPGAPTSDRGGPINWVERDGKVSPLRSGGVWINPQFSPEGARLALQINDGKQNDIFVYDWARDALTQMTFDPGPDSTPLWTPNGKRIVFTSDREVDGQKGPQLFWMNADGTGEPTRLTDEAGAKGAHSWHPSGKYLAFQQVRESGFDLMILPMEGDEARGWKPGKPRAFLSTPAIEVFPKFSPDGRWIAYFSNESGPWEVYVRPFEGAGKWKISSDGGGFPRWSRTKNELLFVTLTAPFQILAAPYSVVGDSFRADKPIVWTPTPIAQLGTNNSYDLHPDGKRLAAMAAADPGAAGRDTVVFIFNFFEYLRGAAPAKK
jgi:serine/threonine-protein kinase